jgi:arylsulfatase A-like enzyme
LTNGTGPQSGSTFRRPAAGARLGLKFGFVTGICLAAAELLWIGLISHEPPLCFLLYLFAGDIALISLMGAIVGGIFRFQESEQISSSLFGLLVVFVYIGNGIYRSSLPGLNGKLTRTIPAFLVLFLFSVLIGWFFQKQIKNPVREAFESGFILPVLLIASGIVGIVVINKIYLPDLFTPASLLGNGALGISLAAGLLLSHHHYKGNIENPSRMGLTILGVFVAAAFSVAFLSPVTRIQDRPKAQHIIPMARVPGDASPVILVVIDTLRADHVSAYEYKRATTPNLDELVRDSRKFAHAITPAPWTLPAHASLLTGLVPSVHGADFVNQGRAGISRRTTDRVSYEVPATPLAEAVVTLPEVLSKRRYKCGAIVANFAYLWRGFQLDQGFSDYDDSRGVHIPLRPIFDMRRCGFLYDRFRHKFLNYRNATDITDVSLDWLKRNRGGSFFLFINYMDTHTPYAPPPKYRKLFAAGQTVAPLPRTIEGAVMEGKERLPEAIHRQLANLYDAELCYVDAEIGRIIGWLKEEDLYDPALLIITSDHGESLGEHGFLYHMNCLYEHELHVPLIVKYPQGEHGGETVTATTSLADIPNIILAALHMPPLAAQVPLIAELSANRDRVNQYGSRFDRDLWAVYRNGKKFILSSAGTIEVYNLEKDPSEACDVAKTVDDDLRQVSEEFKCWTEMRGGNRTRQSPAPAGKDVVERLRALGYLN